MRACFLLQTLVKIDKDKNRKVDFPEWMAYMEGLIAYMDGELTVFGSVRSSAVDSIPSLSPRR